MTTSAIQNIFTEGDANVHMLDALEAVNYQARENFNYIFTRIMNGLNITPDTPLYFKVDKNGVNGVILQLFTDKELTQYTELDVLIEKLSFGQARAVTLGVADTPYVTFM